VLDLITEVRSLALEAELKRQKSLAAKLRAVGDEEEATTCPARSDRQDSGRTAQASDRPPPDRRRECRPTFAWLTRPGQMMWR
jgi:hypothetical protein